MKPATAALQAYLLAKNDVVVTDLYTFSLIGGQILRLWDYPLPQVSIPSANFPGSPLNSGGGSITFTRGPRFGRNKVTTKIGVEPAELDVEVYAQNEVDLVGDLTWGYAALLGVFDGATVELDRFFMPVGGDGITGDPGLPDTTLGAIVWFYGLVSDVDIERTVLKFKVKATINILQQQQMPRRIFQSGCTLVYGGPSCGYDRVNGKNALGTATGLGATNVTATGGSQNIITMTSSPSTNYTDGSCVGLTGANANLTRGIQSVSGSVVSLTRPFPYPITSGDTFQLLPGCDHTIGTCNTVMLNLLRYGGFDYVPPPELSV
jgi:hypothetical protein